MKSASSDLLAQRFSAQALAGHPLSSPLAVAERILAVQGQDPRGFRLAVRVRTRGLTAADVDRALAERELLVTWLNRGTLHLVRSEDYPWLQTLTTPPLRTAVARRLGQDGVSPAAADRAADAIEKALADDGPLTREQLRERIEAVGTRAEGQALVHLLFFVALRGTVVRGPMVGRQHAFVLVEDWLPAPGPVDRDAALAELARRYLAGHAPASDRDLARWAGLPLRDVRAGLAAIAGELDRAEDGLLRLRKRQPDGEIPPPRLLGAYDPVLLGWRSREEILGASPDRVVSGGLFRPFAIVDGRAAGIWRWREKGVSLDLFDKLSRAARSALEADAGAVAEFLGAAGDRS